MTKQISFIDDKGNYFGPINAIIEEVICQSCDKNKGTKLHTCPYNEDVNNNDALCCNCCKECTHECLMDI